MNPSDTIAALVEWLRATVPESENVLVPVSGGSDSALNFWLCHRAFGDRVTAVHIGKTIRNKDWFENVGTMHYGAISQSLDSPEVERWAYFLSYALRTHSVLVGSTNKTELTLGTFSSASRVASVLPLAGLWKSQVMELCEFAGVPSEVLASSLRADPECGRPEIMASINFTDMDNYLRYKAGMITQPPTLTSDQTEYLEALYERNRFKHDLPFCGPELAVTA